MTLNRRDEPVNSKPALRAFIKERKVTAGQCLKRVPLERRLRLLKVRIGSLALVGIAQSAIISASTLLAAEIEPGLF